MRIALKTLGREGLRPFLQGFFIAIFLLVASVSYATAKKIPEHPQLAVRTIDGEKFTLSTKNNKVVLVVFWASWCVECRKELQALSELYPAYKNKGFELIGINIDDENERAKVIKIAKNLSFQSAILIDGISEESEFKWLNDFGAQYAIPTNYFIDKTGKLRMDLSSEGVASREDFAKTIDQLLNE